MAARRTGEETRRRKAAALKGLLHGYYEEELKNGGIVLERSRLWLAHLDLLDAVLGPQQIVVVVRDLADALASMERLMRSNVLTRPTPGDTTVRRVQRMLMHDADFGQAIEVIRDALSRGYADRMILVRYPGLCEDPVGTMNLLHKTLGLPAWDGWAPDQIDGSHLAEDDMVWGLEGLHDILPRVPSTGRTWRGVLPPEFVQQLSTQYADIQRLVYALSPPKQMVVGG